MQRVSAASGKQTTASAKSLLAPVPRCVRGGQPGSAPAFFAGPGSLLFPNTCRSAQPVHNFATPSCRLAAFTTAAAPAAARRSALLRVVAQAVASPAAAPAATAAKPSSSYQLQTLTTWLLDLEKAGTIDNELAVVISSIATACKQIGSLVNRAGISNLTGLAGETNVQGEDQKKLDVISNEVFANCLRSRCASERARE